MLAQELVFILVLDLDAGMLEMASSKRDGHTDLHIRAAFCDLDFFQAFCLLLSVLIQRLQIPSAASTMRLLPWLPTFSCCAYLWRSRQILVLILWEVFSSPREWVGEVSAVFLLSERRCLLRSRSWP